MAGKTRTIVNTEEDVKDLGVVDGKHIVIGSKLDRGLAGHPQPEAEVTAEQWRAIQGNKALKATMDFWERENKVVIR